MLMAPEKKKPGPRPDPESKRSQGANRHRHPRKAFHAEEELFKVLEEFALQSRPQASESAVMRDALIEYFTARDLWPPKPKK